MATASPRPPRVSSTPSTPVLSPTNPEPAPSPEPPSPMSQPTSPPSSPEPQPPLNPHSRPETLPLHPDAISPTGPDKPHRSAILMAQVRDYLNALPPDFPYRHCAPLLSDLGLGRYPEESLHLTPRGLSTRILREILSESPQPRTAHNTFTDWGWVAGCSLINHLPYFTPKIVAEALLIAASLRTITR